MADDKTVYVTFEFQGNVDSFAENAISKVKVISTEASKAFLSMTEGSSMAARAINETVPALENVSKGIEEVSNKAPQAFQSITNESEKVVEAVTRQGDAIGEVVNELNKVEKEASDAYEAVGDSSEKATGKISLQKEVVSALPAPLQKAVVGFGLLSKTAIAFVAIPIVAVITAIVLGLKAMFSWFNSSAEGQMKFAKISGYLSGVLGQLKEIVFAVGKAVYEAFSNPQAAVKKLWETIKTNIVNRVQGVGEMFKALGKIISSGFTDGFDDLKNSTLKAATGVENLDQKIKDYVNGVHDAAKATSDLRVAEERLARDRSEWEKRSAELDVRADELRSKIDNATGAERAKLAKEYEDVMSEKHAQERSFLEEELRIKKELANLTTTSQSDIDEINKLEASLIRLKAEQRKEMEPVQKKIQAGDKRDDNLAVKDTKAAEKRLELQRKYNEEWINVELYFEQRQVDLLDDSFYKQQRQSQINHKKRLADAASQENEILNAKREAYGADATLSEEEKSYFTELRNLVTDEYWKEIEVIKESIDEAFKEGRLLFADELTVQLADIDSYYDKRIRQAEGNEELIKQLVINKEKEITLARNTYKQQMLASDLELTKKRIENAQKYYKFTADKREAELKADIKAKEEQVRLLEEQYSINPTENLANEIALAKEELIAFNNELRNIPREKLSETANAFAQITGALGGIDGEIGAVFSTMSNSFGSISESFSRDTSSMAGKVGAISTAISSVVEIINTVIAATNRRKAAEQAFYKNSIAFAHEYALALNEQVRLQSTGNKFVTDYSGQINDAFTSLTDANEKFNEAMEKLSEGKARIDLRDSVDWNATLKTTAMGAAAGAAIGSVIPVIGTAIGAVVGAVGGFFVGLFGGKKKTDVKDGLLDVFPELVTAAGDLNRELAQTLINTEQVDDNTKQLLQNALDWADAVDAAREQIANITTELAGDIGNSLRSAIVEAWKAGEDASERMFDKAADSLENFITQMLYSTVFSDIFDQFSDMLVESLDPLSGDQNILDDYEWLMKQMQEKDDLYIQLLDSIKKRAQEMGFSGFGKSDNEQDSPRQASSKGIQSVAQDSVNEMNGRLTALLIYQDAISVTVGGINAHLMSGLSILRNIEKNTEYCRYLEQMRTDLGLMKSDISSMNTRGITVKTA